MDLENQLDNLQGPLRTLFESGELEYQGNLKPSIFLHTEERNSQRVFTV